MQKSIVSFVRFIYAINVSFIAFPINWAVVPVDKSVFTGVLKYTFISPEELDSVAKTPTAEKRCRYSVPKMLLYK